MEIIHLLRIFSYRFHVGVVLFGIYIVCVRSHFEHFSVVSFLLFLQHSFRGVLFMNLSCRFPHFTWLSIGLTDVKNLGEYVAFIRNAVHRFLIVCQIGEEPFGSHFGIISFFVG